MLHGIFSSGSLGCISYPRHLLTYSFSSMAEASDIGEPSYLPFRTLSPALQLSSEMISILTMLERLVPRPSFASHCFTTQLICDSVTPLVGNFSLRRAFYSKVTVWSEDSCYTTDERNASPHVCLAVWTRGLRPFFCCPAAQLASAVLEPLHEAFRSWLSPSGSLGCIFYSRHFLTYSILSTAEASDICEFSHSSPHILSPTL